MIGPVMLDVEGLTLTDQERDRLQNPLIGGIILFSRNFNSVSQVKSLVESIRALRSAPFLICVDHEGGRVQRFKKGFSILPAMGTLGALYRDDPVLGLGAAEDIGRVLAYELVEIGIDFSFTPVLDLDFGRSEVIGKRAFSRDPKTVSELGQALIRGLKAVGSAGVGKHFPGHGYVEADSHHALPIDERAFEEIEVDDLIPFKALSKDLAGIMPAHVVYRSCDAKPAGFSRFWLQDVLRSRLGFEGAIFSDDLAMAGAHIAGRPVERAESAFSAGCDMVLLCNDPTSQDEFLRGVERLSLPDAQSAHRLSHFIARPSHDARHHYEGACQRLQGLLIEGYQAR